MISSKNEISTRYVEIKKREPTICERALEAVSGEVIVPEKKPIPARNDGIYINRSTKDTVRRFQKGGRADTDEPEDYSPFASRGDVQYNRKIPVQPIMVSPYHKRKIARRIIAVIFAAVVVVFIAWLIISLSIL